MKYFKWLHRMLLLFVDVDKSVPDYPIDLPESHWPQGYLRRRRKELNLFLMQCSSIEWIRDHELYAIFLTAEAGKFEIRRKKFDKYAIENYRNLKDPDA